MNFKRISVAEARALISRSAGAISIVDTRDEISFSRGHIGSAFHLTDDTLQQFINGTNQVQPLLVYCYHGNMSKSVAAYLAGQGFTQTYSLDGGYEAWSEAESSD